MKKKKDPPMDTPKPRTALLIEGENDVTIAGLKHAHSTCETDCKDQDSSCIKFGSINNAILTDKRADIPSKPRTALLQGGEDDEHMAPQINSASNQKRRARECYKEYDKLDCDPMETWRGLARTWSGLQTCPNYRIYGEVSPQIQFEIHLESSSESRSCPH